MESQEKPKDIEKTGRLVESESEPSQIKRLALTHEVGEKITELRKEELDSFQPKEYEPKCSFCIRTEQISQDKENKKIKDLEERLGNKFLSKENTVDLENPEVVLKAYESEKKVIISKIIQDIDRGLFERRKNQNRPFSSPISLEPITARALLNLSGLKSGKSLLDPLCGTGGILIEAGLCGVGVAGFDLQEEMIDGCRKNLEEYGIISYNLKQQNLSDVSSEDLKPYEAIVTDLPYGKSSKKTDNVVEKFLELIDNFKGKVVFMYDKPEVGVYKADFSIYIHKNLTRHIFVLDR